MQDCYLEEYPVHGGKIPLDILQPNSCLQNLALVRPNIRQQLLNLGGWKCWPFMELQSGGYKIPAD